MRPQSSSIGRRLRCSLSGDFEAWSNEWKARAEEGDVQPPPPMYIRIFVGLFFSLHRGFWPCLPAVGRVWPYKRDGSLSLSLSDWGGRKKDTTRLQSAATEVSRNRFGNRVGLDGESQQRTAKRFPPLRFPSLLCWHIRVSNRREGIDERRRRAKNRTNGKQYKYGGEGGGA